MMRKAEYQTLAEIIGEEKHRIMNAWFDDENERLRHLETVRRIAERFARHAHVDKPAFLKACDL